MGVGSISKDQLAWLWACMLAAVWLPLFPSSQVQPSPTVCKPFLVHRGKQHPSKEQVSSDTKETDDKWK